MSTVPEARCLFRDGPGLGPIVAIQDSFGKVYRLIRGFSKAGEILCISNIASNPEKAILENGKNPAAFRVLGDADHATMLRLVRAAGYDKRRIAKDGMWYEGVAD